MNIHFIHQTIRNPCFDQVVNPLRLIEKKVIAIALTVLMSIALAYYLFHCCDFTASEIDPSPPKSPAPVKDEDPAIEKPITCPYSKLLDDGRTHKMYSNGLVEIGHFKNDQLDGPEGLRIYDGVTNKNKMKPYPEGFGDIRRIKGECKNGAFTGKGKMLLDNHRNYEGRFVDGILVDGEKRYTNVLESSIEYEKGEFVNDKLTGFGEVRYKNGYVEQGMFHEGKLRF